MQKETNPNSLIDAHDYNNLLSYSLNYLPISLLSYKLMITQ